MAFVVVVLAFVVAVIAIVLLATPPKPELVKVRFVGTTNEFGTNKLVFEGTNGTEGMIVVFVGVIMVTTDETKPPVPLSTANSWTHMNVPARTNFYFSQAPPPERVSYSVKWGFSPVRAADTRREKFQMGCFKFFMTLRMSGLAMRFVPKAEMHSIPSTEIKE